jgi:hypothetical protein
MSDLLVLLLYDDLSGVLVHADFADLLADNAEADFNTQS